MFYKFQPFKGPAKYVFKDPDTEREFIALSKNSLMDRITVYRAQNNLEPIEQLSFVLENYWCSLPENYGKCVPVGTLQRGLLGYVKGGIALLKNIIYSSYVTQEEAEKRAAICVQCPYNIFPDKDGFIKWADEIAYHSIGGRKTSLDDKLGNCEICTCVNKAKVHLGGEIVNSAEINNKFPDFCWQKK